MKLINHVLKIRSLVQQAIDNRFAKMGIKETGLVPVESLPQDLIPQRQKLEDILNNHLAELQDYSKARQETINECTFTLFNKIAAIKVMEEKELFPEVIKRRPENGNKSFAHNLWLEENPGEKTAERQGLKHFLQAKFNELGENFSLYNENYPYSLMPTADELYNILEAYNEVEIDPECGEDVWKDDDILGWLYENFNTVEKQVFKESGEKTEYDKVTLQSQFYTPKWVVKFLVDNSLCRYYLEMYPDSIIVKPDENGEVKYKIANATNTKKREIKKLEDIRIIDPACGSGNFLIYTFDLLYDLYVNQIEQYGADYTRRDIPKLILENNIYGVDIDERAVQLSQIALFIKAKEKGGRRAKNPSRTNVVSTHFFLPDYSEVESEFVSSGEWDSKQRDTIKKIWSDLQNAYKFGTLVRVEEVLNDLSIKDNEGLLFADEMSQNLFSFKRRVTEVLRDQVKSYCERNASEYALTKAVDAMTFLDILSNPFDIAIANPPYTDSGDFGDELKGYLDENYKKPQKFSSNLYSCFIKRCCELVHDEGIVAMVTPQTFMYIKVFDDVRDYLVNKLHIELFVEWGYLGMFTSVARVNNSLYILEKKKSDQLSTFIKLNDIYEGRRLKVFMDVYEDLFRGRQNNRIYRIQQRKLSQIKSSPFIYWISDDFRSKFKGNTIENTLANCQGLITSNNNRFLRYWWEVDKKSIGSYWFKYAKGGAFNKWYGNECLTVNWRDNGYDIKHFVDEKGKQRSRPQNEQYYFKEGVTYCSTGTKGTSYRLLESDHLFDSGGSSIFGLGKVSSYYILGILNSKLSSYVVDCLNPTVNTQVGDIGRIPMVISPQYKSLIEDLSRNCVNIKRRLLSNSMVEVIYTGSPISPCFDINQSILSYLNEENAWYTQILVNEAVLNDIVFSIYNLSDLDKEMIVEKKGKSLASLPVSRIAKERFIKWATNNSSDTILSVSLEYIQNLDTCDSVLPIEDFESLYQANNEWEDFCIRHNCNPIEAWYQFRERSILPDTRARSLCFELITTVVKEVLDQDDDGVIPLIDRLGEEKLSMRVEQALVEKGFSTANISQICRHLGASLDGFFRDIFFEELCNHLNLFMFLPKAPFIWHLTSGENHALELFVSIYRWDRNVLFRIKSIYAANRESDLKDKLATLNTDDPLSQLEANRIKEQLKELKVFVEKIDNLLSIGYSPDINDGVGKNIAPLQHVGLISYEVLNAAQLKKYLNADW